jgi:LmbE family N-acetylglucosaminyl deacetylase
MEPRQLRVMAIGAHPDDCEYHFGGTAALYKEKGHIVKFVSVTSGNAGHQSMGREELKRVRAGEASRVSETTGIEYEILGVDDGALVPDLASRELVISAIRRFRPDIVFAHRPYDYHADHRAVGLLMQDASFLLGVPLVCPSVPCLRHVPVIMSFSDNFTKPVACAPHVAVDTDAALDRKAAMLDCHRSQFYDWLPWVERETDEVPQDEEGRLRWLTGKVSQRDASAARRVRDLLIGRYGAARGRAVQHAEAFETSEYGAPLPDEKMDEYFPF